MVPRCGKLVDTIPLVAMRKAERQKGTVWGSRQAEPFPLGRAFPASSTRRTCAANLLHGMSKAALDFRHCIIGGGAVGLAIAARLAKTGAPCVLLERNGNIGEETSARNSEVIHAGLYYPKRSLKTRLCIEGNELLYEFCKNHYVPFQKTGKWIVAQNADQMKYLENMHTHASALGVPTRFVPTDEVKSEEPDVRAAAGVLESPNTGIFDSHTFMTNLRGVFEDNGGDVALRTNVRRIDEVDEGYRVSATTGEGDDFNFSTTNVINSAGHGAADIANLVLPKERHVKAFYAKGTYFSYGASSPKCKRLIYPCPEKNLEGLGSHLTLDLGGRLRFGPNVEWTNDPNDLTATDYHLNDMFDAVQRYLPNIVREALSPDYCGIRPKLRPKGSGFQDFVIRREDGLPGWINLLGIESPGLTSALSIARYVETFGLS